ncbi:uncharacterized protein [Dermacentor albipictus]|uniref:uncharacterized protein n=1 Tax=Dermacentor albipictus TaxID=60249 RepID=UPI0038FC2F99
MASLKYITYAILLTTGLLTVFHAWVSADFNSLHGSKSTGIRNRDPFFVISNCHGTSDFPPRRRILKPGAVPTIYATLCPAPLPKRPRRQSCSDTEREPAAPHPGSMDLNADYEINEAANASGEVKLDAPSQRFVEVRSKATQAALKATTKSAKVQASRTVKEVACQTDLELPDILLMEEMRQRCSTPLCSEPSMTYEDNTYDKTYEPTLNSSVALLNRSSGEPLAARKFIVYEECLLQVFQTCKTCGFPAEPSLQVKGSLVTASVICQEKHVNIWHSQPKKGKRAVGDITLAAAIFFTGCSVAQSLRFLKNAGVACFSERSYHRLQSKLLLPAVNEVWQDEKRRLVQTVVSCGGGAKVAGDSRADSPGYSAKYGVYSVLETNLNRIIDIELVQCNEVSSSTHMELEGLKRALASLDHSGIIVTEAVTDRHPQVRRYFKSERPEVDHLFDAWHVCKGLNKKLLQAAKSTGCAPIGLWTRSIVNHLYFSVHCGNGSGDLAVAVWLSVMNHIQDKHHGHSLLYDRCQHGDLEPRKWIFPATHAYDKLSSLSTNKRLLTDIRQISPHMQTFSVESFHAIINRFAPKAYAYSFHGMFARTALAALHYNENADKGQAVTLSGELRWKVKHPKARNGEASVSSVKQAPTYGYVNRLFCTLEEYINGGTPYVLPAKPPHVTSSSGPVDKTSLVQSRLSRFGKP